MGLVELEPEDLGIAFIEVNLVLRFGPLSELGVGFGGHPRTRIGALGPPNGCTDAIVADVVWVDVSVEAMEEDGGNPEEDEEKSE